MNKIHKNIFDNLWGELLRGKADAKHDFRYPTLATEDQDNWPDTRTLVLRDVIKEDNKLIFFTDMRSHKMQQIAINNKAALLFYTHKKKLQLRIRGLITVVKEEEEIKNYFNQISQTDLKDYRSLSGPGSLMQEDNATYLPKQEAFNYFSVLSFNVISVDYLQLSREGHARFKFIYDNREWEAKEIVP
jgi:hypothetical protein